eukprot:gene12401-14352_t
MFGIDVENADDVNDDNNCFTPELCALLKNNANIESLCFAMQHEEFMTTIPFIRSSEDIAMLPKLITLTLQWRLIEDESILALMNARSVIQLNLRGCKFKVPILSQIAALCPQLEKLDLAAALGVTDDILGEVTTLCPHIVKLDISDNRWITDAGVLHMRCAQLRTVHLAGSDIAPFVFSPKALRNLTNLEIDCNLATVQNVATISTNGASLQRLRMIGTYEPTPDTVFKLVNGCPSLRELSMIVPLDPVESIPEYLTGAHWENIRPGLRIDLFVVVPTEIIV